MKKVFLTLLLVALHSMALASVTAVKWGEDANKVLRVVVDLTEAADFEVKIENKKLSLEVNTPFEGNNYLEPVRSIYAEHMTVAAMGTKTLVELPLTQALTKDDVRGFTLKQDPVTKRPSRIVVDISKKVETATLVAAPAEQASVVSGTPKVTVGSMPKPAATPTAITPPPIRSSAPVTTSAPKVTVNSPPPVSGAKVTVGSMPTNKSEAQARATQRGKEAVEAILGRVASGNTSQAPATKPTETKGVYIPPSSSTSVPSKAPEAPAPGPIIMDSVPPVQIMTPPKATTPAKAEKKKAEFRTKGGIRGKIVTIDPGHGGSDPGAVSDKNTYEKTITLSMAKKLKGELEKMGATVYLTRSTDTDVARPYADDEEELQARVNVAEKRCSDLFISLHINASVNKKASGISTYYFHKTSNDDKLAKCIHKQLTTNFKLPDMGAREANFYVIKRCTMPAVLMELGFISNKKEEKVISGNWFQNKAMDLVAEGIRDYFK